MAPAFRLGATTPGFARDSRHHSHIDQILHSCSICSFLPSRSQLFPTSLLILVVSFFVLFGRISGSRFPSHLIEFRLRHPNQTWTGGPPRRQTSHTTLSSTANPSIRRHLHASLVACGFPFDIRSLVLIARARYFFPFLSKPQHVQSCGVSYTPLPSSNNSSAMY
jgi:hypothetical protein